MKKVLVAFVLALLATAYAALGADPAGCPSCTGDDHKCCPAQPPQ
jgi:hypothetical protein